MEGNRFLPTLAVAILLVTAGCSSVIGTTDGPSTNPNAGAANPNAVEPPDGASDRTVAVGAGGQVETAPTRAVVRVSVTSRADNVETVRRRLAENASSMRQALRDSGIGSEQITTADYDIRREHRFERERGGMDRPRVRGRHSFVITVENTSRVGQVVVTAVENGASTVNGVRFTVDRQTRLDLRKEAIANATRNARERAEVAAGAAGLQLAGVSHVETSSVEVHPIRREGVGFGAGGGGDVTGAPTSFEGGTVTISAQVQVVYNATEA